MIEGRLLAAAELKTYVVGLPSGKCQKVRAHFYYVKDGELAFAVMDDTRGHLVFYSLAPGYWVNVGMLYFIDGELLVEEAEFPEEAGTSKKP